MSSRSYLAVTRPGLLFFTIGRPFSGIVAGLLKISIVGRPFAIAWAVRALDQYEAGEKTKNATRRGTDEYDGAAKPSARNISINTEAVSQKHGVLSKAALVMTAILILFFISMAVVTSMREKNAIYKKKSNAECYLSGVDGTYILDGGHLTKGSCGFSSPGRPVVSEYYDASTDEAIFNLAKKIDVEKVISGLGQAGTRELPFKIIPTSPESIKLVIPNWKSGGNVRFGGILVVFKAERPWRSALDNNPILKKYGHRYMIKHIPDWALSPSDAKL